MFIARAETDYRGFVELIQKVEFHPKQLIRRLSAKGVKIKSAEIEAIFQHYQLRQKKND